MSNTTDQEMENIEDHISIMEDCIGFIDDEVVHKRAVSSFYKIICEIDRIKRYITMLEGKARNH